ncbi:MAG: LacI family DNA-binding transcriptional regulator [Pseudomonadota bacterium]
MPVRPTTRDLAKAAGVSLATVDRVLNGRSGVRKATVQAVTDAIAEIGFERNVVAARLARRRGYRFAFVLPEDGDQFLSALGARIHETADAFASEMIELETFPIAGNDPHKIAAFLGGLDAARFDGVAIMAPETPQVRDAIRRLAERGIRPLAFLSDQAEEPDLAPYVGIDNRAAGATAGALLRRFAVGRKGPVIVVGESLTARNALERRLGFDRVLGRDAPELHALPTLETHGDASRTREIVATAMQEHPDLVGVYVLSSEARIALEATCDAPPDLIRIVHERTPFTENALRDGLADAVITQDQGHLVRSAVRTLRARCDRSSIVAGQERIRVEILIRENL